MNRLFSTVIGGLLGFALILSSLTSHSQQAVIDSLHGAYQQASNDSARAATAYWLGWQYRKLKTDSSRYFAQEALSLSIAHDWPLLETYSHNLLGIYYRNNEPFDSAFWHQRRALTIRRQLGDSLLIAEAFLNISTLHKRTAAYDSAVFYIHRCLATTDSTVYPKRLARYRNSLGDVYFTQGDFEAAMKHYLSSLEIRERIGDSIELASSYLNMGAFFLQTGNNEQAFLYLAKSQGISARHGQTITEAKATLNLATIYLYQDDYASAEQNYLRAATLYDEANSLHDLILVYGLLGTSSAGQKNWPRAISYFLRSNELALSFQDSGALAINNKEMALAYEAMGKLDSAIVLVENTSGFQATQSSPALLAECYLLLSRLHAAQSNFDEAYRYSDAHAMLLDSVQDGHLRATELQSAYELEKSRAREFASEAARQQEEILRLETENRLQRNTLLGIGFGIGLITLLFFAMRRARRARAQVQEARTQLQDTLRQKEVEAQDAMIEGRDQERLRVARDLHDELGALLSTIKIHFGRIQKDISQLQARTNVHFEESRSLLDQASSKVRQISEDLRSGVLHEFGLIAAVQDLCHEIEKTGQLNISLHFTVKDPIPDRLEQPIFRIVTESLQNILKHSQAKTATLQLLQRGEFLHLSIEDDGVGFDPEAIPTGEGMGLNNMRVRAEKWFGNFKIDSRPGRGTTLIIEFDTNKLPNGKPTD